MRPETTTDVAGVVLPTLTTTSSLAVAFWLSVTVSVKRSVLLLLADGAVKLGLAVRGLSRVTVGPALCTQLKPLMLPSLSVPPPLRLTCAPALTV